MSVQLPPDFISEDSNAAFLKALKDKRNFLTGVIIPFSDSLLGRLDALPINDMQTSAPNDEVKNWQTTFIQQARQLAEKLKLFARQRCPEQWPSDRPGTNWTQYKAEMEKLVDYAAFDAPEGMSRVEVKLRVGYPDTIGAVFDTTLKAKGINLETPPESVSFEVAEIIKDLQKFQRDYSNFGGLSRFVATPRGGDR